MYQFDPNVTALRAAAKMLKTASPRKRGTRLYLSATIESWDGPQLMGWAPWNGSKRGLLEAKARLLDANLRPDRPLIRLHLTHSALSFDDPVASAASADVSRYLFVATAAQARRSAMGAALERAA